jgi:branched-chain amino acid transport system permease protein
MGAKVLALLLESAATGGLYVTVALGLSLVAGVMRLLNLAQGEFLVGSVYIVLMLMKALHIDPFLSMLGTLPIVFAGAYLIQRHLLQKLMTHSGEAPLVATFGLSIAAQATFQILYGSNPVAVSSDLGLIGVSIFGHTVRWISILAVALGIALTVGTHFLLVGTTFGRSLRAAAEDPLAAQSLGVDVRHVFAMCFGLGAVLTACGAVVVGIGFSVEPTSGLLWLIRGVTVVVIGGMGSIWGTLFAGGLVGLVEEVGVVSLGPEYRDLVIFTLLVALLVVRPSGLFSKGLQ